MQKPLKANKVLLKIDNLKAMVTMNRPELWTLRCGRVWEKRLKP